TAPPVLYPLPLHAALPISGGVPQPALTGPLRVPDLADQHRLDPAGVAHLLPRRFLGEGVAAPLERRQPLRQVAQRGLGEPRADRSAEHTSELQSRETLVCR